ncbi:aminotransferase class I/II-fold pyridoxal phosphate-dependent enzyme [Lewinella sp. IMCC34191]|uniref:aminotransferase class I/II-fold pyridoxal phosphate-dependent enzyme n=1 Tax=Lewinella sp. IMCC34191 TaxID=2259172 RepID=UPI000E2889F2|nr:8-amino-7-oxononanoate synthase [Lewinella sp. IMCC34191]
MAHTDFLHARLQELREAGQFRELPSERSGVDFWSNDYLGFSRLHGVKSKYEHIAPGSRLISGNHPGIIALEDQIANFHGFPAALLFGSGYTANLGLLSCIAGRTDTIVYDELIHASLRDGIRLSGAAARRYKHNRVEEAERLLGQSRSDGQTFLVTEGRFSMDGDTAPLSALADICTKHGALLIVDEAHSVGLDGPRGAGLVAAHQIQDRVFADVVTYGKAPGFHGAAILGSTELRDYLINFSRPFIFSTGPRPGQIVGIRHAYSLLEHRQEEAYRRLLRIIEHFSRTAAELLPGWIDVTTGPIQLVPFAGNQAVMQMEEWLHDQGFLVKAIRSPSVPRGTERLRICLHAFNTPAEVTGLIRSLAEGRKRWS